jgi:hypothetical protein
MKTYWFVVDFYSTSAIPTMEKMLMEYAHKWDHHVVSSESIDEMILELRKMQTSVLQTRRLKVIGISKFLQTKTQIFINVGTSHIMLLRVENNIAIL